MAKQFSYREITGALENKLEVDFASGSERTGWYYHEGKKVTRITLPHIHRGDVPIQTLNSIRRQALLTTTEFEALIECSMTATDYLQILRAKGLVHS